MRNKRRNTKVNGGGGAPWWSEHTHSSLKGTEAHEGPMLEQVRTLKGLESTEVLHQYRYFTKGTVA